MTFAEKAFLFHRNLRYTGAPLLAGINIMNPFRDNPEVLAITKTFLDKYFNDHRTRRIIFGINPGRLGAGLTGISFTDPKRLVTECGIPYQGKPTHEPSSVFVYDMIRAYGGPQAFYQDFYINSPCPLGFTATSAKGKELNYNYYDSKELIEAVRPFIVTSIKKLIALGIDTDRCFCLGSGKNSSFLNKLNQQFGFFKEIIPLEHPRYIMQYRSAEKENYISKFLEILKAG